MSVNMANVESSSEPAPEPSAADARLETFRVHMQSLKVPGRWAKGEQIALVLGVIGLVAGIVIGIVAYASSHSTSDPLAQRDAIVLATVGLIVAVVGGALFVRFSLARILRFWIARVTFEQSTQTDRLIDALRERERPPGY